MKTIFFIISIFLITISCDKKKIDNSVIESLKKENKSLKDDLDKIKNNLNLYIEFEKNVKNEYVINPDSTISIYLKIKSKKANPELAELIKTRIEEIERNKIFWNETHGWRVTRDVVLKKPKFGIVKEVCQ